MTDSNIAFLDVSEAFGISKVGLSYGVTWGDVNGDGLADIWVNAHFENEPILYLNQGSTFVDATSSIFEDTTTLALDNHGSAWADIDNDGDQDLIQLVAGEGQAPSNPNSFYINDSGTLKERGVEIGLNYDAGRSKSATWFDYDKDGLLDLFHGGAQNKRVFAPPTVFKQTTDGFIDVRETVAPEISTIDAADYGFLSDLSGDGRLDLILPDAKIIYDLTSPAFTNIADDLLPSADLLRATDGVAADFNGDLRPDLFLTRDDGNVGIGQSDAYTVRSQFVLRGNEKGYQFSTAGELSFQMATASVISPDEIFIGSGGFNPTSNIFNLSPDDPNVQGIAPHVAGVDKGVYIGYDPVGQTWQVLGSNSGGSRIASLVESTEVITNVTAFGFSNKPVPKSKLLINTENGLIDYSQLAGIDDLEISGESVVAGDFDNDMDIDIYILNSDAVINPPNILLENQGDGTFLKLDGAGGAEGSNLGLGESVSVADYDNDGFLDFFITNGLAPQRPLSNDGPHQLFRNQGNSNHWLEIDLVGVLSNRDAIGTSVLATASGKTQLREQSGGFHKKGQNFKRLHFGLGQNTLVDTLEIKWDSGISHIHEGVSADQIVTITEESGLSGNDQLIGNSVANSLAGFAGDDILEGGLGADILNGGEGLDVATYENSTAGVTVRLVQGTGTGGDADGDQLINIENVTGSAFRDRLFGNASDNSLLGGEAPDRLDGKGGDDLLEGGNRSDLLIGGRGNDILIGGNGLDKFRFKAVTEGVDTILDFESQKDLIQVKGSRFSGDLIKGFLPSAHFVLGTTATNTDHRFIYDQSTGRLSFDADGIGGQAQKLFAVLDNQSALVASDIRVI